MYNEHEIDFTLDYLAQPGMLLVGAVLTDLSGVQEHLPCAESKCKGGGLACVQKKVQRDRDKLYTYLQDKSKELGARAVIHQEGGCTIEALMKETRYADLLVISQETYLATTNEELPRPVSSVLEQCFCPVLVLPPKKAELQQLIMTFDGSVRAMNGIKLFSYLMAEPNLQLPATVLTTYPQGYVMPASEEKLFIEYLKQHFSSVGLHRLCESSEHTLATAVGLNENALVVVNNPSQQNLPLLRKLLNGAATLHAPFRLYTPGAHDPKEEVVNG